MSVVPALERRRVAALTPQRVTMRADRRCPGGGSPRRNKNKKSFRLGARPGVQEAEKKKTKHRKKRKQKTHRKNKNKTKLQKKAGEKKHTHS